MNQHARHVATASVVLGLLAVGAGAFAYSGLYNIGADDTHTRPVYAFLQTLRDRSIDHRARSIQVPDLSDPALIRQGAGNYNAMCTGCHLAPGMAATELSKGLYPSPPNLSQADIGDPSHHFWVIKHGIKASGMPAWGKSMQDQYIWGMVAFLQQLPKLDDAHYDALVGSSGGHSHGGGESGDHHHDHEDMPDHHHDAAEPPHHHDGEDADHDSDGMQGMGGHAGTSPAPPHEHADDDHQHPASS
jgi:mono/diheme cytochrome c family protein